MGTTRRDIRRDALRDLGDLLVLTATAASSDDRFIDTNALYGEDNAYRGREAYFSQGTAANLGQIRYVTGSQQSSMALGFGVSLPAEPQIGDVVELINTRGTMYRFQYVHGAINAALRGLTGEALVPLSADEQTYARGEPLIVPAGWDYVEDLQYLDPGDTTVWRSVPKATRTNGPGWSVDRAARTVVVGGQPSWNLDTRTVKVWGLGAPPPLWDDDDETDVDHEWLVAATQAKLAFGAYQRGPTPEKKDAVSFLEGKSRSLRRKVGSLPGPFAEPV